MTTTLPPPPAGDWSAYIARDYDFSTFPPGARVLDIGFGMGWQMVAAERGGARTFGLEYSATLAKRGAESGLRVCRGSAEALPFASASLDGIICKVVILLTDEKKSVAEIARVMRPGAIAHVSYHGIGYSLRYLMVGPGWKRRVYGVRTMLNTAFYRVTRRRLPGFMGDTLFQTTGRLQQYYRTVGLELVAEHPASQFAGCSVFIYHTLRRS
jgi:SAM-dependent methyltransferase